jgi:N-succinyldiaminopimelate aminotransferase
MEIRELGRRETPGVVACRALEPYGTSIFTDMTLLANAHGAVNLSQGFPDFDGPEEIRRRAADAILAGPNQYAPTIGVATLRQAVAEKMARFHGVDLDPDTEVTATAGATEGLAAAILGLVEPGDEVVLLDPSYDLYPAMIARAGGVPVHVPLEGRSFALPQERLAAAFGPRTKAIVVNNPQNPCGKVYTADELAFIAGLCRAHGAIAIGDEVYEHIVYDGRRHASLLAVPGLRDRAIVVSSTAKTFSMTGWKVGTVAAAKELTRAVRMSHQFLTYCTPPAFQIAMAAAIRMDDAYYDGLGAMYAAKRDRLCAALADVGLDVLVPEGTYYASVRLDGAGLGDDTAFCRFLATEVGVAAIPSSAFYEGRRGGRDLVRFCFCKRDETLDEAIRRLGKWRRGR